MTTTSRDCDLDHLRMPSVTNVSIKLVANGTGGLIGWVSCVVSGAVRLNNIALRRGDRGLFVTYPRAVTPAGNKIDYFHPINADAARVIEDSILAHLAELHSAAAGPSGK